MAVCLRPAVRFAVINRRFGVHDITDRKEVLCRIIRMRTAGCRRLRSFLLQRLIDSGEGERSDLTVDFQTVIFLELFNGVIGIAPEVTVGAVRADTVSEINQILLQFADFNSF